MQAQFRRAGRHQRGFIQGAILVGLALLVLVVAGFSMANRDAAATTNKEEARLNAAVMLKQSVDLKDAIYRAVSDNANPSTLASLKSNGYLTEVPTAPRDSATNSTPVYTDTVYTAALNGSGSASNEVYFVATPVSDEVCKRINGALYNTPTVPPASDAVINAATGAVTLANGWVGRSEGCAPRSGGTGNDNIYYKAAVVR